MKCENSFCKILGYTVRSSTEETAIIQIYCQYLPLFKAVVYMQHDKT